MDADQLLQALALNVGMPDLRFDDNGCACIAVDGGLAINFEREAEGGAIHVYSVIGPLPLDSREEVYRQLLDGNLYGTATAGATLAVDSLRNEVVLCRRFDAAAAGSAFFADVHGFVAAAEDWQERLRRPVEEEEGPILRPARPNDMLNQFMRP